MDQKKTGEFLKQLRESKGLTQMQLAEHFYISSRTVSRWETGSNLPDMDMLLNLSDFYNVDVREIIDGERKSENMNDETKDTLKKVAEYAVKKQRTHRNRIISSYAGCGAIVVAIFNILFNEESMGLLTGIVSENICKIVLTLVTAAAFVGAGLLAMYALGLFDMLPHRKHNC